jgi:hypothetical protein
MFHGSLMIRNSKLKSNKNKGMKAPGHIRLHCLLLTDTAVFETIMSEGAMPAIWQRDGWRIQTDVIVETKSNISESE